MTTWLPAMLIGSVLGYGIIFLRELGWIFAIVVTLGLLIVYVRQGRLRDFGLLLTAEGIWPAFVAARGLVEDTFSADVEVGPEMWVFLAVGLLLIVAGLTIFAMSARGARGAPEP